MCRLGEREWEWFYMLGESGSKPYLVGKCGRPLECGRDNGIIPISIFIAGDGCAGYMVVTN
jgi:hypothetical protein